MKEEGHFGKRFSQVDCIQSVEIMIILSIALLIVSHLLQRRHKSTY